MYEAFKTKVSASEAAANCAEAGGALADFGTLCDLNVIR
jgi:hypothetical protein